MTNKSKKILFGTLAGVLIPSTILGFYFGGIAIHNYNTFTKPYLPKEYEKEDYEFDSKIISLNKEAEKYFSINENALKSKQISKIVKSDDEYYFVFNWVHRKCQVRNTNQDDYFSVMLKVNQNLFDDIFKELNDIEAQKNYTHIQRNENNVLWHYVNRFAFNSNQKQDYDAINKKLNCKHIFIKDKEPKFIFNLSVDYLNKKSSLEIKNLITKKNIEIEFKLEMKRA
ncbi:hypothetical protein AB8O52_01240 [Mycoplasmopsis arginini]|uniref:hypothetical protein n=1 Tax=Mycoplasmopsis arginini TaxID=2094 RepID=UPI003517615B